MIFDSAERLRLERGAESLGIALSAETLDRFLLYATRLEETNRTLNLTRVPPEQYIPLHFLDSLAIAKFWTPKRGDRLLDLGTGAGFPGLPIALLYPALSITLMDGTLKRLRYLDSVIEELEIKNVKTLHGRAEEVGGKMTFDIVTARAVARLPKLLDWMLPLVTKGGIAVAYKGQEAEEEVHESETTLKRHRARVEQVAEITLPDTDIVRRLVFVRH